MGSINNQGNSAGFNLLSFGSRALHRTGRTLVKAAGYLHPQPKLSKSDHALLERNRVLKDCHRGRRAFVIGTGPSLQNQNIAPLANELTYVMSGFWKHESTSHWQPTYYCISDPLYFDGSKAMKAFFDSLRSRVHDSTFFLPLFGRSIAVEQKLLPEEKTYWLAFSGDLNTTPKPSVDLTEFIPSAMTVSQLCLMTAIYMGCSPIYLLGLDHDWLSHRNQHQHFYQGHAGLESHPEVKPSLADHSYKTVMECALVIWQGYEVLNELARKNGISILNATDGGFLDVFDRVDYQDVISS